MNACLGACKIRLQWNINKNVTSTDGIKSRMGCGFQTHEVDSADNNERCESVEFCTNVCMHVWGHVRFDCNGILIEMYRLPIESRVERGVAFKLMK